CNHGLATVALDAELRFGSDFRDIFEVRGMRRYRRGSDVRTVYGPGRCLTTYGGLDGEERYCQIRFSRQPDAMALGEAVFRADLAPGEEWDLVCRVSAHREEMPGHDYARALSLARQN